VIGVRMRDYRERQPGSAVTGQERSDNAPPRIIVIRLGPRIDQDPVPQWSAEQRRVALATLTTGL
jgi:hypothetical protein